MNALNAIAIIAEQRIEEAIQDGAFDNLPGMGKPLELEDLSHIPEDLRMAYTLLKNGGYLTEKTQASRPDQTPAPTTAPQASPMTMQELLADAPEESGIYKKMRRIKIFFSRIEKTCAPASQECGKKDSTAPASPHKRVESIEHSPYLEQILKRM